MHGYVFYVLVKLSAEFVHGLKKYKLVKYSLNKIEFLFLFRMDL
jgi:hypothetical protein